MRVRVTSTLDDLERDLSAIPAKAATGFARAVGKVGRRGKDLAKTSAKKTAGRHGKHYPNAFTVNTSSFFGFGGGQFVAEYGPEAGYPQGGMSFEWGSRNQPPHLDLNHSADIAGPLLEHEVLDVVDRLFW